MPKKNKKIETPIVESSKNIQTKLQIYNFLPFVQFSTNYCFGVQNAWISLLMISFGTTYAMDRFIWLIPLFMTLMIRPYAYNFIYKSKLCKVYLKAQVIAFLHLFAILGVGLVIYSPKINQKNYLKRIILCTIGWTTMDLCLGIASFLAQQLKVIIQEDPSTHLLVKQKHQQPSQNIVQTEIKLVWHQFLKFKLRYFRKSFNYEVLGQTTGYIVSILICVVYQSDSFEEFFRLCDLMYLSCGILQLYIFLTMLWKIRKFQDKIQKNVKKRQKSVKMFQGILDLMKTNFKERVFLAIHFIIYFTIDAFVIFTTYWVGAVHPKQFELGITYCYGVKVGSAYLVLFMIISNTKLPKIKNWDVERTLNFMKKYSIFYLIVAILCFTIFEERIILIFVITGAVLISIYKNKIYPLLMKQAMFRSCVDIVQKMQKIFRVSLFPLFVNIVFQQKALNQYPIWVTLFFLSIILIGILVFFVDVQKRSTHQHKKQDNKKKIQ